MKKIKPIRNMYKIKKQWGEIIGHLTIPNELPFNFTKNFKIISKDGKEKFIKNKKEFEKYVVEMVEDGKEIDNIFVELNYEKLITSVEKKFDNLIK